MIKTPRVLRRDQRLAESSEELEFHLETEAQANMDRGMSREEAYSAARIKLGNPALVREDVYGMTRVVAVETFLQDLLYALRVMRKRRFFTVTVILTLAIGIGGNTAAFSVIRALLLRPLQYREPNQLVEITADYPRRDVWDTTFNKRAFDALKAAQHCFTAMGTFLSSTEPLTLSEGGESEALKGARVSAKFLDALGVTPAIGRGFLPEEETPGGPEVALLSHDLWERMFGGKVSVLGKSVDLNSMPYTIVGVLPEGFAFPLPGADIWLTKPAEWSSLPPRVWNTVTSQTGFARLKPGISLQQAEAEIAVINRNVSDADSGAYVPAFRITRLSDHFVANIRPTLWILFGVAGFVLLLVCANVVNLMLVQTSSRAREFAIRTSLEAPRGRLVRQLLTESVLLSFVGGVAGLLLARWSLAGLTHITLLKIPGTSEIRLDSAVLAFNLVLSVIAGVLFGLFPSFQELRRGVMDGLRESGAAAGRGTSHRPIVFALGLRGLLVITQVAISVVLLVGATLLLASFVRLQDVNPGFNPARILTAKIALAPVTYDSGPKRMAFADDLLRRVEQIPGVQSAAMTLSLPSTTWYRTNIQIQGQPWDPNPENWPSIQIQSVTPGYFRTLQIPLERGRDFTTFDNRLGAPTAVIINESFARRFWPAYPRGENPVGQRLREGADKTDWVEIVGIAGDVREGGLAVQPLPEFYVPWVIHSPQTPYLIVRTTMKPLLAATAVRKQVQAVDPREAASDVESMEDVLQSKLGQRRLTMWLVTSFAAVAFLLAVIGIYGVVAYSVAQRTQEVGIRRALGAEASDIMRIVISQAFVLALSGIAVGMFAALGLTRVMKDLLFDVTATDPYAFCSTAVLFLLVALAASFFPAYRAAKVDPMQALRVN